MDVQASETELFQNPLRQDQAIGSDHHRIGVSRFDRQPGGCRVFRKFAVQPQAARLDDGNSVRSSALLDRRRL